jgi:hypothetical protein
MHKKSEENLLAFLTTDVCLCINLRTLQTHHRGFSFAQAYQALVSLPATISDT